MFIFDYPKVKHSLALTALQDPYPAWVIDPQGLVRGANLMAFWISETLKFTEQIKPDALLGRSIFNIFTNNFERIPIEQNIEFYSKKSSMVRRMKANSVVESSIYDNFVAAMEKDPLLKKIYEEAPLYLDNEWEHPFCIMVPGRNEAGQLLAFQVTIYRLEGDVGLLTMCTPTSTTLPEIEEQYGMLISEYGNNAYVQLDDQSNETRENTQIPANFSTHFHSYYPSLIQDPLWYISGENKAHQLLARRSVVGVHFFEMFFAPQLKKWMGPVQETSAPRAMKYFTELTSSFLDEKHEMHAAYEQTLTRLLQLQEFRDTREVSQKLRIRLYIPDSTDVPFYTCRVILPWPLSPKISLQFRSMVKFMYRNRLIPTDIRDYHQTLVPENDETEVALILLHLAASHTYYDDDSFMAPPVQFLWLLNIMRTVKEGLAQVDGEEHKNWEPEPAFRHIHDTLVIEYSEHPTDDVNWMMAEFRETVATLDRKESVSKKKVLFMLHSLTSTLSYNTDQLSDFLLSEIERYKSAEIKGNS